MKIDTIFRTAILAFAATFAVTLTATPAFAEQPDGLDLLPDAVDLLPDAAESALLFLSVDVRAVGEVGGLDLLAQAYPLVLRQLERPELIEKLNFDTTTDVHSLACAVWLDANGEPGNLVVVASGNFNPKAIIDAIQAEGEFAAREIAGYDVLVLDTAVGGELTRDLLFSVADGAVVLVIGDHDLIEGTLKRLAVADRQPSPAAPLLEPYEGMFRFAVNTRVLPEEFWQTAGMKYGATPENLVSLGMSASLEPVEQLVTEVEVKAVLDTLQKARDTHLAVFGGIETAKQWAPLMELLFDRTTLKCEDTAVSVTMELEPMLVAASITAGMIVPFSIQKDREAARRTVSVNNQKQICAGLVLYVDGPGENQFYPQNLRELFDEEILEDKQLLVCPADPNAPHMLDDDEPDEWYTSYEAIFDLTDIRLSKDNIKPETMVIWDKEQFHDAGRIVGFGDGSVRFVFEEEFQQMLLGVKEMLAELEQGAEENQNRE